MIYIENNLKKQDVFVPRNDTTICYVSPYDKGYQDGYQDGLEDCGDCPIQQKEVVLTATTETISPDQGYVGMDSVFVDARQLALEKYNEGYHEGAEDGAEEQKDKLTSTAFTQNGIYTREDGWSAVTVDVPKDINLGTLVDAPQMSDITYEYYIKTFDPQEASVDGWGEIRLYMGTLIGESKNEQKALMTATTFTQNGLYKREDGWNEVIVEVPQTGTSCNLESKTETVTADTQTILPSSGYDGMSEVVVDATDYGQDKYDEGYADGQASVPPCPPCPEIESAVTYGIGSGFTGATVTPSSGYDGMAEVTITDNGYGQEKYDEGHDDGYNEGFTDGQTDILSGMTATAFTQNDTYTNASGWSAVTVNVPQTGSSCNLQQKNITLESGDTSPWTVAPDAGYDGMSGVTITDNGYGQEKYDEGHSDGYDEGYQDGLDDCSGGTCNLEAVSYAIPTGFTGTTITPSSGYDGMSSVAITDGGYGQEKFDEGYANGTTDALSGLTSATFTRNGTYTNQSGWSGVTVDVKVSSRFITYRTNNGNVADIEDIVNPNNNNIKWFHAKNANGDDCHILGNMYLGNYGYIFFDDDIVEVGGLWVSSASSNSIIEVTIPNGVEKIERICGNSPITTITLPNSLEEIGFNAFYASMSLTSLTIPSGVTTIGEAAFADCTSLPTIVIPDSVTEIGVSAFQNCPLSAITLGTGVQFIGRYAFDARTIDRYSLKNIYAHMEGITWNLYDNVFNEYNVFWRRLGSGTLYVPNGHSAEYADWLNALPSGWTISDTL